MCDGLPVAAVAIALLSVPVLAQVEPASGPMSAGDRTPDAGCPPAGPSPAIKVLEVPFHHAKSLEPRPDDRNGCVIGESRPDW